jgi:hypothetical protein
MTRSPEEIERDVEATRDDLDRTVEALKEKMTPKNIASEMMGTVRNSRAGQRAVRLGHQAQDNAVPLALIGAGLAWMFFNNRRESDYEIRSFRPADADYDGAPESGYLGSEYEPDGESRTGALRQKARRLTDTAKDAIGERADRARQAAASARDTLSSTASTAAQRARTMAGTAREQAVRYGHRAEETFLDTLDREPLVIGALGLAVGAAVGAALPSTPIEDRYVGPLRDRALDEGKVRAKEGLRQAKEVATAAVDTVKQEAQTQGFTDVQGLVDKVEQVARAGADTVKREVEIRRGH